jgi:hypothetical protein
MEEIASQNRVIYVVKSKWQDKRITTNRPVTTPPTLNKMPIALQSTEGERLKTKSAVWDCSNPVETWTGPRASGGWGFQISRRSAPGCGKVVSPTHRTLIPPKKYLRYSFLLEAESTPGSWWGWKGCVNEKFQWCYNIRVFKLLQTGLKNIHEKTKSIYRFELCGSRYK